MYMYFFFCVKTKEKNTKKKSQDCIFSATLFLRFAKEKNCLRRKSYVRHSPNKFGSALT